MKIIGIILIVIGALALAREGFYRTRTHDVVRVGDAHITATTQEKVNVPPYVGFILVGVGVALVLFNRRTV